MTRIQRQDVDEMVAHAREDLPNECCGILVGQGNEVKKIHRMTNVEASPFRFSMDPLEIAQVDKEAGDNGWELLAIYHSHTRTEAYPSDTDVRLSAGISAFWPDVRHILVSLMDAENPRVRLFQIDDGTITETPFDMV